MLILQPLSQPCSESSQTSEMEVSTKTVHRLKPNAPMQKAPPSDALVGSENICDYNLSSDQIFKIKKKISFPVETKRLSLRKIMTVVLIFVTVL